MRRSTLTSTALLCAASLACSSPSDEKPATRTYGFHILSGMSMGAIGSAWLAGSGNTERLDGLGLLGGPMDGAYFLANMERNLMGGFCSLEQLEALAEEDPTKLNDPSALDCSQGRTFYEYEHHQNFNEWRFTTSGGSFDRTSYLDIFEDLSLAIGNPLSPNPDSGVYPFAELTKERMTPELCENPIVLEGVKHLEYNPEGRYPLITFCDGQQEAWYCNDEAKTPVDFCSTTSAADFCQALGAEAKKASASDNPDLYFQRMGAVDHCRPGKRPVVFLLAVDINGNGKRDYHEPLVTFGHERFRDTGVDGCPNEREDGKGGCTATGATGDPNKDDFHYQTNPLGTENNFVFDAGEPYDDNGLDGVPGTGDFGEGNGRYDDSPHRARYMERDLRRHYLKLSADERRNLDVYIDGGNRDVFNLGLSGDIIHSAMRALEGPTSRRWVDMLSIPSLDDVPWNGSYDGTRVDYARFGRNAFFGYGVAEPTIEQIRAGDGDHVGTTPQLLARFTTFLKWVSHRWDTPLGTPGRIMGSGKTQMVTYFSEALNAPREFNLALPPGYNDPKYADTRYPVLFLKHGYGMDASGMSSIHLLLETYMQSGDIHPMIVVYPSGRCCFLKPDGSKDCRDTDDDGSSLDKKPGYTRECIRGNFYQNRVGYSKGDESRYGDSIFEIMDYVDQHYRVLEPVTLELD